MPQFIGAVLSRRLATLHEIDTVYGTQDLYDMLEVATVDDFNQMIWNKHGNRN